MATADPSIYNALRRPGNVLEYAQGFQSLRGNEQAMQARAAEEGRRAAADAQENALMQFERTELANLPEDQLPDAYQRRGYITQAENLRTKRASRARDAAETERTTATNRAAARTEWLQGLNGVTDREAVKQRLADGVQARIFSMKEATALMQAVPTDPQQFADWRDSLVMGPDRVADNRRQAGQAAETARHNRAMEDAARAAALKAGAGDVRTQVVEGPNGFMVAIMEGPKMGQTVPLLDASGTQVMGKRAQTAAQKARDAADLSQLAAEAAPLIPQATGSGVGAATDWAAGLVGISPSGADAIAKLKVIQGKMLALTERMEGPQSNYDVQIYQQAVGNLADPNVPTSQKQAALQQILNIQERYFGRGPAVMPAPAQQRVDQVPSGRATPIIPPAAGSGRTPAPMASTMVDLGNGFFLK